MLIIVELPEDDSQPLGVIQRRLLGREPAHDLQIQGFRARVVGEVNPDYAGLVDYLVTKEGA